MKLEIVDLKYYYTKDRVLFSDVNLTLDQGDILSILGPNGAGKSTLLNCITGILDPICGDIFLDGRSIRDMDVKELSTYIGYVPQENISVYDYTVEEYVVMGSSPSLGIFERPSRKEYEMVHKALDEMGILHLKDRIYTNLSGGERQKASIAKVLVQDPKIIILDEPTSQLDYGNQYRFLELAKELSSRGYTIILTTHQPDHCVKLGGDMAVLDGRGRFYAGATEDILTEDKLSRIYEADVKIGKIEDRDIVYIP